MSLKLELKSAENVAAGVWRIRIGIPEETTPVSIRESPANTAGLQTLQDVSIPISPTDINAVVTPRGIIIEIPLDNSEEIFGFGLQLKSVNQKGHKKTLRVNSDPLQDSGDSHAPVPFYVSTAGYGVLIDTARYATFYVGASVKKDADIKTAIDTNIADNTDDLYKSRQHDKMQTVVEIPFAKGVDIYIFSGPNIREAVQRYNLFSGGGAMPPRWGLGVWYRAWAKCTNKEIDKLAADMRNLNMPCDVLGLEPGWQSKAYSCSFVWDNERFPNSDDTINSLSSQGFKTNLWEHCFTHPESPIREQIAPFSGDHLVWSGVIPDFLEPDARKIFADYHYKTFVEKGISGFKLDECDNSDFAGSWSFPELTLFPSGVDGEQMHSLLGILYQRTMLDAFKLSGKRTLSMVRSSHALAAPLPFVLYSDLYDHKDFLRGLMSASFSGLLWCPEVRQCASTEDLVRRIQSVVLSPLAQVNAWMIPSPPWFQVDMQKNLAGEEMSDRVEAENLVRDAFNLRMALVPYLYTAFAKYRDEGIPPFRSLAMDYPNETATHSIYDQWMIGDSLMTAPLVAGQADRKIYLPKGKWYDFWTGESFEGEKEITYSCSLERIPIFVIAGKLIPLAKPVQFIDHNTTFEIEISIYGNETATAMLYDDDGENLVPDNISRLSLSWSSETEGVITSDNDNLICKYNITGWRKV
jgi:alpha-D-xyloside xylohydrolase